MASGYDDAVTRRLEELARAVGLEWWQLIGLSALEYAQLAAAKKTSSRGAR